MKKKLFFLLLLTSFSLSAQTRVKWNAPATLVLIPHVGIETPINSKWTYQVDAAASFWESFKGYPVKAALLSNEFRYYPKENFKGLYFGPNITGVAAFKIRKPTAQYKDGKHYQEGYSIMMGASLGYQFFLTDKLSMDFTLGGGFGQGFYKHYLTATGIRDDRPEGAPLNKTGEWWPVYRAGVMLGFKL